MAAAVAMVLAVAAPGRPRAQITVPAEDLLRDYRWRSIGPGAVGGRITDIESVESNFSQAVVGTAGGGAWKTANGGMTWTPVFDRAGSASIGDVAIFQPDPALIWIGTGAAGDGGQQPWGDGVYRSIDGGETFERAGLRDTFQIARVVTHPTESSVVYVAAAGNPWSAAGERGLFKTIDDGATWQKLANGLPTDPRTGACDLIVDRSHPDTLYAAFQDRSQVPARIAPGSATGGIFKSIDAGRTWRKLTAGLPASETGRIGLDISRQNPAVLVASVEQLLRTRNQNGAPVEIVGSSVYRSEDGGESWRALGAAEESPATGGAIRLSPSDDTRVFVLGSTFRESDNAGRTLRQRRAPVRSSSYHAMWIDPANTDRYYLGTNAGLAFTADGGETFRVFDNLPIAPYQSIAVDSRDPYAIYGAVAGQGAYATMSFTRDIAGIRNDAVYRVQPGDALRVAVHPGNWRVVYTAARDGLHLFDPVRREVADRPARPEPGLAEASAADSPKATGPLVVSTHDAAIVYLAGNRIMRTVDLGQTWTTSSANPGSRRVVALAESPVARGMLWAGTDDGRLRVSRDGGTNWTDVALTVPGVASGDLEVRDIKPSAATAETAYVVLDGRTHDDRAPYLFKTINGGRSWINLSLGLPPNQPINVVLESSRNSNLLFAGTKAGVQVSLDAGQTWRSFGGGSAYGMPTVSVRDLVIHPRDRDLVAATDGRGLYIVDDISALEAWRTGMAIDTATMFEQREATLWVDQTRGWPASEGTYAGENPPSILPRLSGDRIHGAPIITVGMGWGVSGLATLVITASSGDERRLAIAARPGITRYRWDGRLGPAGLAMFSGRSGTIEATPGEYRLSLTVGGRTVTGTLRLRDDPLR